MLPDGLGFVTVETASGETYKIACFAMICHACGKRYVEFFPNAKQENLFIGLIHAFQHMGVQRKVLADNMKSIVLHRDEEGHPVWQKDYELFMGNIGFGTKLCKPRHPFTKGAVERLVRYVKDNFIAGRVFTEITDRIAVFDKGRIVQLGTHEELLADAGGKYYELWNAQAQYYAREDARDEKGMAGKSATAEPL